MEHSLPVYAGLFLLYLAYLLTTLLSFFAVAYHSYADMLSTVRRYKANEASIFHLSPIVLTKQPLSRPRSEQHDSMDSARMFRSVQGVQHHGKESPVSCG